MPKHIMSFKQFTSHEAVFKNNESSVTYSGPFNVLGESRAYQGLVIEEHYALELMQGNVEGKWSRTGKLTGVSSPPNVPTHGVMLTFRHDSLRRNADDACAYTWTLIVQDLSKIFHGRLEVGAEYSFVLRPVES